MAIYSTFLQRAYDQLIHDVALQNLDVTFCLDRAGLVGEDGPTHAGAFDISYLRCIPNMVIATPSDENETRLLLNTAYQHRGPSSVRYPRGSGTGVEIESALRVTEIGKAQLKRQGLQTVILSFGALLHEAVPVAEELNATLIDMRFVKPLDESLLLELADSTSLFVSLEENSIMGGAGSAVLEFLQQQNIFTPVLQLGLPDRYIEHGKQQDMRSECGLDSSGIRQAIEQKCEQLDLPPIAISIRSVAERVAADS